MVMLMLILTRCIRVTSGFILMNLLLVWKLSCLPEMARTLVGRLYGMTKALHFSLMRMRSYLKMAHAI